MSITVWRVRAAVALAVIASATQLVDYSFDTHARWLLAMNSHATVFGAVSILALLAAVIAAALCAVADRRVRNGSAVLAFLLSILLTLRILHPEGVLVVALPFAVATFLVLWRHWGTPGSDVRRMIRVGSVVLAGAYLVHAFGATAVGALGYADGSWAEHTVLVLRHSGELCGWLLVASGVAAAYAAVRKPG
jgi:hypothetical protein